MPLYLLNHNREEGPYDEALVAGWLAAGRCAPGDLARRNPDDPWQPLQVLAPQGVPVKRGSLVGGCCLATIGVFGAAIGGGLLCTGIGALFGIPILIVSVPLALIGGRLFGRARR